MRCSVRLIRKFILVIFVLGLGCGPIHLSELSAQASNRKAIGGTAKIYYQRGLVCEHNKDYQTALNLFLKAVAIDSKSGPAWVELGLCCEVVGKSDFRSRKFRAVVFLGNDLAEHDNEFYAICLHEIGHALGLNHSSSPEDVMYSSMGPRNVGGQLPTLSKRDVSRIKSIYSEPFRAAKVALQFGTAIYVEQEYEKAYQLLTDEEQSKKSLEQFEQDSAAQESAFRPFR